MAADLIYVEACAKDIARFSKRQNTLKNQLPVQQLKESRKH